MHFLTKSKLTNSLKLFSTLFDVINLIFYFLIHLELLYCLQTDFILNNFLALVKELKNKLAFDEENVKQFEAQNLSLKNKVDSLNSDLRKIAEERNTKMVNLDIVLILVKLLFTLVMFEIK